MTNDEMIDALQKISANSELSKVPRHLFLKETGLSIRQVYKAFGSYNNLIKSAGLVPTIFPQTGEPIYSDENLLAEMVQVLHLPDSKPTRIFFEKNASISTSAIERRFGGWINALIRCVELLDSEQDAHLINQIMEHKALARKNRHQKTTIIKQDNHSKTETEITNTSNDLRIQSNFPKDSSNYYGDFINFGGLQHTPVNEQGVVFLFGMICQKLGYVVETIQSGFPDCEAKRQIPGGKSKWQRVRIEFEFESKTFRSHGHDPRQCDIIVCWENNWPECPIEVLELKSTINKISM